MRKMLKTMKTHLNRGESLVLVTVIASSGATPRGAGARMLIGKSGRLCGTIGGAGYGDYHGGVRYDLRRCMQCVLSLSSRRRCPYHHAL